MSDFTNRLELEYAKGRTLRSQIDPEISAEMRAAIQYILTREGLSYAELNREIGCALRRWILNKRPHRRASELNQPQTLSFQNAFKVAAFIDSKSAPLATVDDDCYGAIERPAHAAALYL